MSACFIHVALFYAITIDICVLSQGLVDSIQIPTLS